MIKKQFLVILTVLVALPSFSYAQVSVRGYTRRNGSYVQPHYRSKQDNTVTNNYGYSGNVNPYTGETGDNRYRNNPTSEYYQPGYYQPNNQNAPVTNNVYGQSGNFLRSGPNFLGGGSRCQTDQWGNTVCQ